MNRKKYYAISQVGVFAILFIVMFSLAGCNSIAGNGVEKREERVLKEYSSIEVQGAYTIEVVCGQKPDFTIAGDENLLPLIKTEVTNSSLKIFSDKSISPSKAIKIKINLHTLDKLSLNGANTTLVSGFNSDSFIGEINGAGTMTVLGKAKTAKFSCNGAGKLIAKDFKVNSVAIGINGANKALVYASDELIATINGAGKIDYFGDPKSVVPTINGIGKINKR